MGGLRTVVEPIPKGMEAMVHQVLGGAEVEPRVEFVDDGFESDDGEESAGDGGGGDGTQDDQTEETSSVAAGLALEEEGGGIVAARGLGSRHDGWVVVGGVTDPESRGHKDVGHGH